MNAIFLDLETTLRRKGSISEVIEIGARKINLDYPHFPSLDTFHTYVRPTLRKFVDADTLEFIGVEKWDYDNDFPFKKAFHNLLKWMGEEYFICTWSDNDKRILIDHCARHDINLDWLKNYNDIQPQISQILANKTFLGLGYAVEYADIRQYGRQHSALNDAINTGSLYVQYMDRVVLETNAPEENYKMSCPLYFPCKMCNELKYHLSLNQKKRCNSCHAKKRAARKTSQLERVSS